MLFSMEEKTVTVVGGGLAGCEAAYQAAKLGLQVIILEMKPIRFSPAHRSGDLAELVCSNSLKSDSLDNASGLLKEELRQLDSLIMRAADATRVPAGGALAVEREGFSGFITRFLESREGITIERCVVEEIPDCDPVIIATGPLTEGPLARALSELSGGDNLYFYDAIAPIVEGDSIDMSVVFRASRYGKGGEDYLNCPMTKEQYDAFVDELLRAEKVPTRDFEKEMFFSGCMPIEAMAERGRETLAHGPMRPVGLVDPRTGKQPYAVVQLRPEDRFGSLYNIVGFQTKLTYKEQLRVFRMIPGLERAKFHRLGSLHRNTYLNGPKVLLPTLQTKVREGLFIAGQLTGVEGYVESAAMGLLAGINAARRASGLPLVVPPETTAIGALVRYITQASPVGFQPMNVNFGLFPPPPKKLPKKDRKDFLVQRALEDLARWKESILGDAGGGCLPA